MNGKENIIQRILADAESKCEFIADEAENKVRQIIEAAEQSAEDERVALDERIGSVSAEKIRNSLAGAKLASRKYRLQKKQDLISVCYDKAASALAAMSSEQVIKLVSKLICDYAEYGEHVRIAKKDEAVVTQSFLDSFGKNLVLDDERIQAEGGILLVGKGYEKDLTIAKLVAYARERTEAQVSEALFGDNNG